MKIFEEYKKSLKEIEAEDWLDIYIYRPLAFIIVKLFYSFPLTPNHYSIMSLTSGAFAGLFFLQGTLSGLKIGALLGLPFILFEFSLIFGNIWLMTMTYVQFRASKILYEVNADQVQL